MLADIDTDYKDYYIFIHEKDQFWPRSDMFSYGQPEAVELPPDTELDIVFKVAEVSNIHREGKECVEEEHYSLTRCLKNYAEDKSNCHVDYFSDGDKQKSCSFENFKKYFDFLVWIKQSKMSKVMDETRCYPKCKVLQYTFAYTETSIDWESDWTSEVYVQPKSNLVKHFQEYYSFDFDDLISSIGGNLGFFLGWSCLTFMEMLVFVFCLCKKKTRKMWLSI